MKSLTTAEFWTAYAALPPNIQQAARKSFRLWLSNPRHPSVRFEPKGKYWAARVTRGYRALVVQIPDGYLWFWIGNHDEYERILAG
jgi:hypothetical protein